MFRTKRIEVCALQIILVLLYSNPVNSAQTLGLSPDKHFALELHHKEGAPPELYLLETATSSPLANYPLAAAPIKIHKPVWSGENGNVAAALDFTTTQSMVPGFFLTKAGIYRPLNFMQSTGNLGKLGTNHDHWVKIRNFPTHWDLKRNSYGDIFLEIKTQVWDRRGARFTVREPVRITLDGDMPGR